MQRRDYQRSSGRRHRLLLLLSSLSSAVGPGASYRPWEQPLRRRCFPTADSFPRSTGALARRRKLVVSEKERLLDRPSGNVDGRDQILRSLRLAWTRERWTVAACRSAADMMAVVTPPLNSQHAQRSNDDHAAPNQCSPRRAASQGGTRGSEVGETAWAVDSWWY